VVIFRPFHENGGGWFWWGSGFRLSSAQVVALWCFTHDYMEHSRGLHNLVWLFESGQPDVPVTSNYPGDDWVDVVGQDVYLDHPAGPAVIQAYLTLVQTGKIVCLSEFGAGSPEAGNPDFDETTLISALRDQMPRTAFFVHWWDGNAGRVGWGLASVRQAGAALHDPWVLNRDDLAYTGPPPQASARWKN
jgi:mannan endo-1,4-beta-mannosidase